MRRSTITIAFAGAVLALALGVPLTGVAQNAPQTAPQNGPYDQNFAMPTPQPRPTVSGTPIPYPAYGTPAPDVAATKAKKGVPQSISLVQATKIAVALSPVFEQQNAAWYQIHAAYGAAQQAYLPGVTGNATMGGTYTDTNIGTLQPGVNPSASPASGLVTGKTQNVQETAGITITQLIYDGGRTIANIRAAKEADYAGRATLMRDLQTLELNVATAYYLVLQDNATVVADNQLVHEFEVNEASVAAQIRNGAAARSDIATAAYQTAQARGNLVTAQGQAIAAQAAFATTLGLDADATVVPQDIGKEPTGPNPSYDLSLQRALLMRPDYIAAQYTVESSKENLRYAKLARAGALTGSASDTTGRQYAPNTFTSTYLHTSGYVNDKTLGLQYTIPIYDQGITNLNVATAASQLDQNIANLQLTKLTVESNVRGAVANLISAKAALVQARAALVAAQVSLDATQAQYKVGATTIVNVATTEGNLSSAQAAYISALYGVQTAEQNYLYALGFSDVQL
ncbi:MAG: TolC family protein [Candidatus Eremiobacteraeota bacterium]|nr:TolC family protein [Candidatus Eremiobacteraeota bacterium]